MAALRAETWRAMENAVTEGKVRAIGVSNFTVAHLETLRRTAKSWPPAVNQVEFHPYLAQSELLAYCKKHGIILQAYASLGGQDAGKAKLAPLGGPLLEHAAVLSAAANHGVSAAQVLLRWALQKVRANRLPARAMPCHVMSCHVMHHTHNTLLLLRARTACQAVSDGSVLIVCVSTAAAAAIRLRLHCSSGRGGNSESILERARGY